MSSLPAKSSPGRPAKLKLDKRFQPSPLKEGDEAYPNGIFEFNITRLLTFIDAHPGDFPIEPIPVADIPDYGSSRLDESAVLSADLSRPVLLTEIAPGRHNLLASCDRGIHVAKLDFRLRKEPHTQIRRLMRVR